VTEPVYSLTAVALALPPQSHIPSMRRAVDAFGCSASMLPHHALIRSK